MSKSKDNEKKSFVMYASFFEAMKYLNDAEYRECMTMIAEYGFNGIEEKSSSPLVNIIFEMAKPNLDAARRRYNACVANGKKGAEYGKLGGAPKGNQNAKKQPLKQPLDVDDNVDVEEDVDVNKNEEVSIEVDADVPSGSLDSLSSFSSSIQGENNQSGNNSEQFEEQEKKESSLETHLCQFKDSMVDITSDEKGKTSIHSKCKSSNSAPISPCNRKNAERSVTPQEQDKEPGMSMSEYMEHLIEKDIIHLAKMKLQGHEYDKTILNRAIDNVIALYGGNDRKTWFKEILSVVENYSQNM